MTFQIGHKLNVGRTCLMETRIKIGNASRKTKIGKICLMCQQSFEVTPCNEQQKFCSKHCSSQAQFGVPSWNKGLVGWRKGEKHPWMPRGEKHWSYKGENVGYRALHQWIVNTLGQPDTCEHCGKTGEGHQMHWANKSGEYKRKTTDWLRLCPKCHKTFDKRALKETI